MAHPGFNPADERTWWWKVAKHLDDAQLALLNAFAHNVDDPRPLQDLQARLREGQAILLYIFHAKGLLPGSLPGSNTVPGHTAPMADPRGQQPVPPPWAQAPGAPPPPWFPTDMAGDIAAASAAAAAAAVVTPAPSVDQTAPVAMDPSSVVPEVAPEADQTSAPIADGPPAVTTNGDATHATEPATPAADSEGVETVEAPAAIPETPTSSPDATT